MYSSEREYQELLAMQQQQSQPILHYPSQSHHQQQSQSYGSSQGTSALHGSHPGQPFSFNLPTLPFYPSSSSSLRGAVDMPTDQRSNPRRPSASQPRPPPPPQPEVKSPTKRKRPKPAAAPEPQQGADSDSYASGDDKANRLGGTACNRCRKLKIKCEFAAGHEACLRCEKRSQPCVVEGKRGIAPKKREYLLAQLREKDTLIQSLLKQLHNPHLQTPLAMANLRTNAPHRTLPLSTSHPKGKMPAGSGESNSRDIQMWVEKAKLASAAIGSSTDPAAFTLESRTFDDVDHSDDEDGKAGSDDETNSDPMPTLNVPGVIKTSRQPSVGSSASGRLSPNPAKKSPKLHSLPGELHPMGLIATMSLSRASSLRSVSEGAGGGLSDAESAGIPADEEDRVGLANDRYFKPGPAANPELRRIIIENQMPPEILTSGLIRHDEVEILFKIFFEKINPVTVVLDPVLHTPSSVYGRCPFLFTVICSIAARFYPERPELYNLSMHFAKSAAASTLIDGWKSVELAQAYALMAIYPLPAKRWEEDRSWLYAGVAIRMCTDLNLQVPSKAKILNDMHEREILNRTRVWLTCFNIDRSLSLSLGRRPTIKLDYIIHNVRGWHLRSKLNAPGDLAIEAYSLMGNIITRCQDALYSDLNAPNLLNKSVDVRKLSLQYDAELKAFRVECEEQFRNFVDPEDKAARYRWDLVPYILSYSMLAINSFAFQQSFQKTRIVEPTDELFLNCLTAASSVLKVFIEKLAPAGYMKYAPEGHYVFATYAAAFLIKLLKPEFASLLDEDQRQRIIQLIKSLVHSMDSVAADDLHSPRLYARFLDGLLTSMTETKEESQAAAKVGEDPTTPARPATGATLTTPPAHVLSTPGLTASSPGDISSGGMSIATIASSMRRGSVPTIDVVRQDGYQPDTPMSGQQTARASYGGYGEPPMSAFSPDAQYVFAPPRTHHQDYPDQGYTESTFDYAPAALDFGSNPTPLALYSQHMPGASGVTSGSASSVGASGINLNSQESRSAMHAISAPQFWDNVMLPGFTFPGETSPGWDVPMIYQGDSGAG